MQTDLFAAPGVAELRALIAGALFATFLLGWLAHWLWAWMARAADPRRDRANELVAELLTVEEERDQRIAEARAAETAAKAETTETRTKLETQLRQREAELKAAMEALRAARSETGAHRES